MAVIFVYRTLLNDMLSLSNEDGADYWREKESQDLGELVQRRLRYLQVCTDIDKVFVQDWLSLMSTCGLFTNVQTIDICMYALVQSRNAHTNFIHNMNILLD